MPLHTSPADHFVIPPEPGARNAPVRTFHVINSLGTLETIYEGKGLTLERAISEETRYFAPDGKGGGGSDHPYDMVVYEGELVAAVIRDFGDAKGSFKVMTFGPDWPEKGGVS